MRQSDDLELLRDADGMDAVGAAPDRSRPRFLTAVFPALSSRKVAIWDGVPALPDAGPIRLAIQRGRFHRSLELSDLSQVVVRGCDDTPITTALAFMKVPFEQHTIEIVAREAQSPCLQVGLELPA